MVVFSFASCVRPCRLLAALVVPVVSITLPVGFSRSGVLGSSSSRPCRVLRHSCRSRHPCSLLRRPRRHRHRLSRAASPSPPRRSTCLVAAGAHYLLARVVCFSALPQSLPQFLVCLPSHSPCFSPLTCLPAFVSLLQHSVVAPCLLPFIPLSKPFLLCLPALLSLIQQLPASVPIPSHYPTLSFCLSPNISALCLSPCLPTLSFSLPYTLCLPPCRPPPDSVPCFSSLPQPPS